MAKYMEYSPSPVYEAAIFPMVSNWDWYVGKLGKFVLFGRGHVPSPAMTKAREDKPARLSLQKFGEQISLLEEAAAGALPIGEADRAQLCEMLLVRNLDMHNQWEVTEYHAGKSSSGAWHPGEVRRVVVSELETWRKALIRLITLSATHFAKFYAASRDFDPYVSV